MATRLDARLAFFCACGRCPFTSSCRAVCLFIRLAFSRSVCLRACLSPGLSVYMCLPQSHRPFMSHFSVFADSSFPLFDSWLMRFSFCLCLRLSRSLFTCLSLFLCLHVSFCGCLFTCLSLFMCLPISLFIFLPSMSFCLYMYFS